MGPSGETARAHGYEIIRRQSPSNAAVPSSSEVCGSGTGCTSGTSVQVTPESGAPTVIEEAKSSEARYGYFTIAPPRIRQSFQHESPP